LSSKSRCRDWLAPQVREHGVASTALRLCKSGFHRVVAGSAGDDLWAWRRGVPAPCRTLRVRPL